MQVKICGVCRPQDAEAAVRHGATYVGVILAPGGPRTRTVEEATTILDAARGARRVAVFVNAPYDEVVSAARALDLDRIQLHGDEPVELVERLSAAGPWRVWKAIRPRTGYEFAAGLERYGAVAGGLLIDGFSAAAAGGVGARFPWDEVEALRETVPPGLELIVAGGLNEANVVEAVRRLRPDTVDVSSGVESEPGVKSAAKIRAFMAAAQKAARANNERGQ